MLFSFLLSPFPTCLPSASVGMLPLPLTHYHINALAFSCNGKMNHHRYKDFSGPARCSQFAPCPQTS